MSLSWGDLDRIINECQPQLSKAWLQEIYQPSASVLLLIFRGTGKHQLLISLLPGRSGIFLTTRARPPQPPAAAFLQFARRHLRGRRLAEIALRSDSRAVELQLPPHKLVLELYDKHTNALIVDADDHIGRAWRDNQKLSGQCYTPAAAPRPQTADRWPYTAGNDDDDQRGFSQRAEARFLELEQQEHQRQRGRQSNLRLRRQQRKLENLRAELEAATTAAPRWLQGGEQIKAELYRLKSLPPTPQFGALELPRPMSATEAMRYCFDKHKKYERQLRHVGERLRLEQTELERLQQQATASEHPGLDDESGAPPVATLPERRARPATIAGIIERWAPDGHRVLVGKNSSGNEKLLKLAKGNDLWLHARDYPGAHCVVVRQGRQEIPSPTLVWAARLALAYSKAKRQVIAEVVVARRSDVRKFKGAKAGQVRVLRGKTIQVKLDSEVMK